MILKQNQFCLWSTTRSDQTDPIYSLPWFLKVNLCFKKFQLFSFRSKTSSILGVIFTCEWEGVSFRERFRWTSEEWSTTDESFIKIKLFFSSRKTSSIHKLPLYFCIKQAAEDQVFELYLISKFCIWLGEKKSRIYFQYILPRIRHFQRTTIRPWTDTF